MEQDPDEPEETVRENHVLVVGLRIVLVSLVVIVGILLVGRFLVAKLDLHADRDSGTFLGGPVPVSPIVQPSAPSPTSTGSDAPATVQDTAMPTLSEPPAPTDIPPAEPVPPGLVLSISPSTVGSGETFQVSGTYAGRDGVELQLQRLEGGIWADYPNQVNVSMGTFSTTASSTMSGANSFRVYDQNANRASNVVTVLVR